MNNRLKAQYSIGPVITWLFSLENLAIVQTIRRCGDCLGADVVRWWLVGVWFYSLVRCRGSWGRGSLFINLLCRQYRPCLLNRGEHIKKSLWSEYQTSLLLRSPHTTFHIFINFVPFSAKKIVYTKKDSNSRKKVRPWLSKSARLRTATGPTQAPIPTFLPFRFQIFIQKLKRAINH